ncbi:MAG TPA: hypothetical protein VKH45_11990 [Candidatus Acidoferrum sp.]|nr:hypothetical protein [Candidatus Acidoferrum sp.]
MQVNEHRRRWVFLLAMAMCGIAATVAGQPPVLPEVVLSAHTVYIDNQTAFTELEYTVVLEINKWGHFQLADRDKADLVLVLSSGTHVHAIPDGQYPRTTGLNAFAEDSVPPGHTRIALQDPKSGATLWSGIHKTEGGKVKNGHLLDELRQAYEEAEKARNKR